MKPIICIAGPTASGKSAWAIQIAKSLGGEIINADALQVYSELSIISARPSRSEMLSVPHHLFGHVDSNFRYSAGNWISEVESLNCRYSRHEEKAQYLQAVQAFILNL